jgi:hypothetical protein
MKSNAPSGKVVKRVRPSAKSIGVIKPSKSATQESKSKATIVKIKNNTQGKKSAPLSPTKRKRQSKNVVEPKFIKGIDSLTTTPSSVIRERILAKVRAEAKKTAAEPAIEDRVSFIAGEPALRMREKVLIFKRIVDEKGPEMMSKVGRVSGFSFIFLGLAFLYAQALVLPNGHLKQVASAICLGENCPTEEILEIESEPVLSPEISFVTVPQSIDEPTMISLQFHNINDHSLFLVSRYDAREYEITNKRNSADGRSDYLIKPDSVPAGEYLVRVKVLGVSGETLSMQYSTPVRFLGNILDTVGTSPDELALESPQIVPETQETESAQSTGGVVLSYENNDDDKLLKLILRGYAGGQNLSVYAAPVQSLSPRYLGLMYVGQDYHVYWLDKANLPSGQYNFVVREGVDGSVVARLPFSLLREVAIGGAVLQGQERLFESQLASIAGALIDGNLNTTPTADRYYAAADSLATELLSEYSSSFSDAVLRLSSARSTNNAELIRASQSRIDEQILLALGSVIDRPSEFELNEVEYHMRLRIEQAVTNNIRFDGLIKGADSSSRLIDSDSDGISDFDEINLYGTDPYNSDSDGDGIIDGVEIVLGFNPLQAEAETLLRYENPRETLFVNSTQLGIWSVDPLVEYDENMQVTSVKSIIKGYGLPNSFITLFIYSDPTIVTVRTAEDGSFEYVLDRILSDGRHEVYAAVTDNKGLIIARSELYAFMKNGQLFTFQAPSSPNGNYVSDITQAGDNPVQYYNYIVVAMGVVSFGVLLLMLSYSLRRREEIPAGV